jgi:uncharacterized phage-associated protein
VYDEDMVTALEVAKYFIDRSRKEKRPITNKKLQKLLYYAQAWSLVLNKERLFSEHIEAWIHGPAVPSVYGKFKKYGYGDITESFGASSYFSKKQSSMLDSVWKIYGNRPADYLEALTHAELPWQEARENLSPTHPSSNVISIETMRKFYTDVLGKPRE